LLFSEGDCGEIQQFESNKRVRARVTQSNSRSGE
jgi:hypothetical protein